MVTASNQAIKTFTDLRFFVYRAICEHHELLTDAFPTSETLLKRGERDACGVMFCLHGPRAVKMTAIWEKEKNRILFYGPNGKRYHEIELQTVIVPDRELFDSIYCVGNKN